MNIKFVNFREDGADFSGIFEIENHTALSKCSY